MHKDFHPLEMHKLYKIQNGMYFYVEYIDSISYGIVYYNSIADYKLDVVLGQGHQHSSGSKLHSVVFVEVVYPNIELVDLD